MIQKKITCHRVLCRILGRRRLPAGTDYLLEVYDGPTPLDST